MSCRLSPAVVYTVISLPGILSFPLSASLCFPHFPTVLGAAAPWGPPSLTTSSLRPPASELRACYSLVWTLSPTAIVLYAPTGKWDPAVTCLRLTLGVTSESRRMLKGAGSNKAVVFLLWFWQKTQWQRGPAGDRVPAHLRVVLT